MRISDWSSDVCSSDLIVDLLHRQRDVEADVEAARFRGAAVGRLHDAGPAAGADHEAAVVLGQALRPLGKAARQLAGGLVVARHLEIALGDDEVGVFLLGALLLGHRQAALRLVARPDARRRSEEHTSELQSLMRISYAVFCLKKKQNTQI